MHCPFLQRLGSTLHSSMSAGGRKGPVSANAASVPMLLCQGSSDSPREPEATFGEL